MVLKTQYKRYNMKKIEKIIMLIILACLCVLVWASVFVWHNMFTLVLFTAGIFVWLWALETEQNN